MSGGGWPLTIRWSQPIGNANIAMRENGYFGGEKTAIKMRK